MNDLKKLEYIVSKSRLVSYRNGAGNSTGSARVLPPNSGGQVQEEWTQIRMITEQLNGK
jgi:hypothetical protein